jgi:oxygen-independent coproporphyrinogen-3 oxidase
MNYQIPIQLLRILEKQSKSPNLGLYLHVPFCHTRCHFCAFYLHVHEEKEVARFLKSLHQEIEIYARQVDLQSIPIETIYFGGGTPTSLTVDQLVEVLEHISQAFSLEPDIEISLEAHPNTINFSSLVQLRNTGFTRLSIGVQSFEHSELGRLGGGVGGQRVGAIFREAQSAGFENINCDLIYGLPGQTHESWENTLRHAVEQVPQHVSCYALTVEEGTRFGADQRLGILGEPTNEVNENLEGLAMTILQNAGFERYEISNFSQPGFSCQHNRRYWEGKAYLGLGPSAHSFVHSTRFGNETSLEWYCQALNQGRLPLREVEALTPEQVACESFVFGLRLLQGVSLDQISPWLQDTSLWKVTIPHLISENLLEWATDRVLLTEKGRRLSDSVAESLMHS